MNPEPGGVLTTQKVGHTYYSRAILGFNKKILVEVGPVIFNMSQQFEFALKSYMSYQKMVW